MKLQCLRALIGCILLSSIWTHVLADRLDEVINRGVLKVGVSDTTPPFSFKNQNDQLEGYDIDLVRSVAKRMNLKLEMSPLTSAQRIPMLQSDQLDFVATSMTRTQDRLKEIDFSVIYFVTPHAVIVKNSSPITSIKHLEGKSAASVNTSTAGGNLLEAQPLIKIKYVRDYFLAFSELKNGQVDAFTTDETVLSAILKEDGHPEDYRFLKDFTKSRDVGFALKKGEDRFKSMVNQKLIEIESSGEALEIWNKWFGTKTDHPIARTFKISSTY